MSVTTVAGSFITLNTINSDHYVDGSIDLVHIGANQIDGTKIALGSDAQGDIMYYDGTNWVRLGFGTSGHFLKTQGTGANPVWAAAGPTAPLRLADGSDAAPTYSFSGATDMGITRSSTELRFMSGGTDRLVIDSNSVKVREPSPAGGGDGFTFRTHNTQDVSTSATVISAGDAANGGFAFVAGHEVSTSTNRFASIIMYGHGNADVVADLDIRGSVAERTYSVSAGDLRLQFASGTYNVQIIYFVAPNMA